MATALKFLILSSLVMNDISKVLKNEPFFVKHPGGGVPTELDS